MSKTGGRIHSSDIHKIGNVTGIEPEDWEGPPELTPPAKDEDCIDVKSKDKIVHFDLDDMAESSY